MAVGESCFKRSVCVQLWWTFVSASLSWLLTHLPACERLGPLLIRAPVLQFVYFKYSTLLPHYQASLRSPSKYSRILRRAERKATGNAGPVWNGVYQPRAVPWGCEGSGSLWGDVGGRCQAVPAARGCARQPWGEPWREAACSCPGHGKAPVGIWDAGSRFQNRSLFCAT